MEVGFGAPLPFWQKGDEDFFLGGRQTVFIDVAKIHIRAGAGGNGAVSFHREKYIAAGGPDGGDGGAGGNIVFQVDDNLSTLLDFRYKRKYAAEDGAAGAGKNCTGKSGKDLVIRVPRGTLIRESESGLLLHDMSDGEPYLAARGGKGGFGNARFATATRQTPRFAKNGTKGEEADVLLELKLLADVGLIGFPNVGKSTLLSVVSAARPKIANYHFTTLQPQLGVVRVDEGVSYVMADIPGLIEGASDGLGLGHEFLRHVERCRLLVHLVDVSGSEGRDPVEDFEAINRELSAFSPALAQRPQILVGSKSDLLTEPENSERLRACAQKLGYPYLEISGATHEGIDALLSCIWSRLRELPPILTYESETTLAEATAEKGEKTTTVRRENNVFVVEGEWLFNLLGSVNFSDYESLQYLHRVLESNGIYELLRSHGIQEGNTVSIYGVEFEYVN